YHVRRAGGHDPSGDLSETVRVTDNPLCRVADVDANGLFIHTCSTTYGTSGAPVFQRGKDGRVRLVGVHLGGVGPELDRADWMDCSGMVRNYGIRLPVQALRGLLAQKAP